MTASTLEPGRCYWITAAEHLLAAPQATREIRDAA